MYICIKIIDSCWHIKSNLNDEGKKSGFSNVDGSDKTWFSCVKILGRLCMEGALIVIEKS